MKKTEEALTMGSLFDGIGGFPLAAVRNGIIPVWASGIEAFPIEVTKLRFPEMVHVGDITQLDGAKLPPVHIICGGSPCQDLSVAGARAGLAGERSGLFMEQIRITKEMRDAEIKRGRTAYVHFTEDQKERARLTDLADLLCRQGHTLKRSGSEYEWKNGGAKITIRGNLWYHQYEQTGGDAIDFVRRFYGMDYPEALEYLLGNNCGTLRVAPPIEKRPRKPFVLPQENENMRRVYAYLLRRRGIDHDVLNTFVYKGMIYESADYHNAVFVGFDPEGKPRHVHKRSTGSESSFKGNQDGSTPEYSFHWRGTDNQLYLFEAPIDMLSFISLHKEGWRQHSYAASCGVSDLVMRQMLKDNPQIDTVFLCRDNDERGQTANQRTAEALFEKGIQHKILIPIRKDWNEDLIDQAEETEEEVCVQPQL